MTELLTGITHQPDFPDTDLTNDNAALLELMMANHELVTQSHRTVEAGNRPLRVIHLYLSAHIQQIYDDARRREAIEHGISTFEVIQSLVASEPNFIFVPDELELHQVEAVGPENFEVALSDFTEQTPRTAEVVRQSSRRFFGPLTSYAVLGAAMSWHFEK